MNASRYLGALVTVAFAISGCAQEASEQDASNPAEAAPAAADQAAEVATDGAQQLANPAAVQQQAAAAPGQATQPPGAVRDATQPTKPAAAPGEPSPERQKIAPVAESELGTACKAVCERTVECAPDGARMTTDECNASCAAAPVGAATRAALDRMNGCLAKASCTAFAACIQ